MSQVTFLIKDLDNWLNSGGEIRIAAMTTGAPMELHPFGQPIPKSECEIMLKADSPTAMSIHIDKECVASNLMPIFCFMEQMFSLISDAEIKIVFATLTRGGVTHDDEIVQESGDVISPMSRLLSFTPVSNRLLVEIIVHNPSQLSVDLSENKEEIAKNSISIMHSPEGYANVFVDTLDMRGQWQDNARVKVGCFNYKMDKPYSLAIAVNSQNIVVNIAVDGKLSSMRRAKASLTNVGEVSIRESYAPNGAGRYTLKQIT